MKKFKNSELKDRIWTDFEPSNSNRYMHNKNLECHSLDTDLSGLDCCGCMSSLNTEEVPVHLPHQYNVQYRIQK
jgi:hypothetical protein